MYRLEVYFHIVIKEKKIANKRKLYLLWRKYYEFYNNIQ